MTFKHWIAVAIAAATVAAFAVISTAAADSGNGRSRSALADAILGTVRYHDIGAAKADGYGLLKDAKGIACIEMTPMPGMAMGAMGIHYVKGSLVGDGAVNAATPEAVVYEPEPDGRLRLVALEYVVFQADWDAAHNAPPSLFGQQFNFTPAGNRYGLPAFYSLHAWIWKHNPSGMFSMWNPDVSCAAA